MGEVEMGGRGDIVEVEAVRRQRLGVAGRGLHRRAVGRAAGRQPQLGGRPVEVIVEVVVPIGSAAEGAVIVRGNEARVSSGRGVGHLGRGQELPGVSRVDRGQDPGPLGSGRGKVQTSPGRRPVQHPEGGVEVRPHSRGLPDSSVHAVERQAGVRVTRWHLHPEQPVELPAGLLDQGRLETRWAPDAGGPAQPWRAAARPAAHRR